MPSEPAAAPERRSNSSELEDREADHFAMCLLMPADMVRREVRAAGGIDLADDAAVGALAKRFGVGTALMAVRVAQLAGMVR